MKLLIVNNSVNDKVRYLIFGYVIAVIMIVMSVNFLRNGWVYKKVWPNSFNIAPIELKLGLWAKSGKVNIPTNFQENQRIEKL